MTTDVPSFELGIDTGEDRVTFIPRGELDLASAPELEDEVLKAVRGGEREVRPPRESAVSRVIEISGIDDALGLVDEP